MEYLECKNELEMIKFFQSIGIIGTRAQVCKKCNVEMKLKEKDSNIDKYAWKCTKNSCGTTSSIRNGTFLEQFNKSLHTFLKMVYHWAVRTPQKVISKELDISRNTITAWQQKFTLIAVKEFDRKNFVLGGRNSVVEVDESLFIKVKHHKGKDLVRPQVWVFGLYERDSKRILFIVVPKRDASTLLNLIYQHVAPNSVIFSDCWASYARIRRLDKNYSHATVNHDLHFVDPKTGVHTNGVESNWCVAKSPIKQMRGISRNYLQSYLDEFCWRRLHKDEFDVFEKFIRVIGKQYPPGVSLSVDDMTLCVQSLQIDEQLIDVVGTDDSLDVVDLPDYENDSNFASNVVASSVVESNVVESSVVASSVVESNVVESSVVASSVVESNVVESSVVESSVVDDDSFIQSFINVEKLICDTFEKLKSGTINSFSFPSILTVTERNKVHQLAENLNIFHITTGTRYRVITVSTKPIEKVNKTNRQKTAQILVEISKPNVPVSENVTEVLLDNNTVEKRPVGRPPKQIQIKDPVNALPSENSNGTNRLLRPRKYNK
jgi:transposase-like protein